MIIKHADDKTKRPALLAEQKKSAALDAQQKDWLDEELNSPGLPKDAMGSSKHPANKGSSPSHARQATTEHS